MIGGMETKSTAMQRKITQLAIQARGTRSRPEIVQILDGMSLNSYYNFENNRVWPQAGNLRKIENAYGWQSGILTELTAADIDPDTVTIETLEHGLGSVRKAVSRASQLSDEELMFELMRRITTLREENVSYRENIERMFEQASGDRNDSNTDPVNNNGVTNRPNHEALFKSQVGLAARRTNKHDRLDS
jgi:hypothetical protein